MDAIQYNMQPIDKSRGSSAVSRWLVMSLLMITLQTHAIPPPPQAPLSLREARMAAKVKLVEASDGKVTKVTELCQVNGTIPVYSDDGGAARVNVREVAGCKMLWKGQDLSLHVSGAMAVANGPITYATASVGVIPPDAVPLCSMCGPQPLADSSAEIKVSGAPKSLTFSLRPNPVSVLNAKPTVWLEADVVVVDNEKQSMP